MVVSKRLFTELIDEDHLEDLYGIFISNQEYLQLTEGLSGEIGVYTKEQMLRNLQIAEWMGRKSLGIFLRGNKKLIGILDYMEQSENRELSIGLIMIKKDSQRHGYGSEILKAFFQRCQSKGFHNVNVAVIENNQLALKFWRNMGFEDHSVTEKRTPSGLKKLICLKLSLDSK